MQSVNLGQALKDSLSRFSSQELTYLYKTGKNELFARDLLAIGLLKVFNDHDIQILREYSGERNDIAVLKNEVPIMVCEAKAWIHSDIVHRTKFDAPYSQIKRSISRDIKKLNNYRAKLTHKFFMSSLVSISPREINSFTKYGASHVKGIKDKGSLKNLVNSARSGMQLYLKNYGAVEQIELIEDELMTLDLFVLKLG